MPRNMHPVKVARADIEATEISLFSLLILMLRTLYFWKIKRKRGVTVLIFFSFFRFFEVCEQRNFSLNVPNFSVV